MANVTMTNAVPRARLVAKPKHERDDRRRHTTERGDEERRDAPPYGEDPRRIGTDADKRALAETDISGEPSHHVPTRRDGGEKEDEDQDVQRVRVAGEQRYGGHGKCSSGQQEPPQRASRPDSGTDDTLTGRSHDGHVSAASARSLLPSSPCGRNTRMTMIRT